MLDGSTIKCTAVESSFELVDTLYLNSESLQLTGNPGCLGWLENGEFAFPNNYILKVNEDTLPYHNKTLIANYSGNLFTQKGVYVLKYNENTEEKEWVLIDFF